MCQIRLRRLFDNIGWSTLNTKVFRVFAAGFLLCVVQAASAQDLSRDPLAAPDTSSPRDTFVSFNNDITQAMLAWRAGEGNRSIIVPGRRVLLTLDLGHVGDPRLQILDFDRALMLKEVLDRIAPVPIDAIPGDEDLRGSDPVKRWRVPGTGIDIVLTKDGPRAGEYLFSSDSLARVEEYYRFADDVPYQNTRLAGIYDEYSTSLGLLFPRSTSRALPSWSRTRIGNLTVWQWIFVLVGSAVTGGLMWMFAVLGRKWDRRRDDLTPDAKLGTAVAIGLSILALQIYQHMMLFGGRLYSSIGDLTNLVVALLSYAGIAWLILLLADFLTHRLEDSPRLERSRIDTQLGREIVRLATAVLLIGLFVYAASRLGVPLGPVLAGLGIGGAAIALAVRPTLENAIAGLTLYVDKQVRIGDFCNVAGHDGTIEDIGLRYTQIRKLDDSVVSLPNAKLAQDQLTNFGKIRKRLFKTELSLDVHTDTETVQKVTQNISDRLKDVEKIDHGSQVVRFRRFAEDSLKIEVRIRTTVHDWLDYLAVCEQLNLAILAAAESANAKLADPPC